MSKLKKLRAIIKEEIKKSLIKEEKLSKLQVPSDVSYYKRDWEPILKSWGNVDYGPRESEMYDWNDRSHYNDVVKEYHAHMAKVAAKLNAASKGLENTWQVWNKIVDKHRKKDRS